MNMHGNKSFEFKATFGVPLYQFMHPLFGFDIVAFDDYVKTPDGISLKQHLINTYSIHASNLVTSLL